MAMKSVQNSGKSHACHVLIDDFVERTGLEPNIELSFSTHFTIETPVASTSRVSNAKKEGYHLPKKEGYQTRDLKKKAADGGKTKK
ncbi:hypothetical protein YC2023_043842 [Brassica napus]